MFNTLCVCIMLFPSAQGIDSKCTQALTGAYAVVKHYVTLGHNGINYLVKHYAFMIL